MMKTAFLACIVGIVLLLSACTATVIKDSAPGNTVQTDPATQGALQEVGRLAILASEEKLTESDFATLETMIADDEHAMHELGEIKTLVKYSEFEHAGHGLSFLDAHLRSPNEVLCPGHALLHYYVFSRHGETELAEDSLEEASTQMPEWIAPAREYNEKYPNGENFDDITNFLNSHIQSAQDGNDSLDEEEMEYLEGKASICIESEVHN